jgi:amino acid adenylation domain-containing protein
LTQDTNLDALNRFSDGSLTPELAAPAGSAFSALEIVEGQEVQHDLSYWKRQLAGAASLNLPLDRPRLASPAIHFAARSSCVPKDTSERLRQFSLGAQLPFSAVLLAAFRVLLLRYGSSEEIVIGCSLAGLGAPVVDERWRSGQNEIVLRSDPSGDPSFRSLARRIHSTISEAFAHPSISLRQLVQDAALEPGLNRPIFQVLFSCGTSAFGAVERRNLAQTHALPVDLHLDVEQGREDLHLHLLYNPELFDAASVDRMLGNLRTLLQGVAENPDCQLSKLPILAEAERRQILVEWNQTSCPYPDDKCLHQLVEAQSDCLPGSLAVIHKGSQLTYREFNARANQLAHYLRGRGIGPNVRVGLCLQPGLDFAVAVLAVLKSGGACVPLDPKYPQERLAYMLRDVQARLVITEKGMLPEAAPAGCEMLLLADQSEQLSRQPRSNPDSGVSPSDVAYVIYTSGSTGKPRGVLLTHTGLVNYNANAARMYGVGPDDRVLQFCSVSFDIALEELFITWLSGATLLLRSEDMPLAVPDFLEWIGREHVTVLDLPTAYWHEWVHHFPQLKQPAPESLRLVIVGGEKVSSAAYAAWWGSLGQRVRWINTYGPTEASIAAAAFEPKPTAGHTIPENIPIGRPLANTRIYLLDRHLNPVPVGVPGELHIGGLGVAQGYLNRPELTAEKFISDPFCARSDARMYKTGDLARYLPSGEIEFLGRGDDQVKIRGFRVELGEIESIVAKHPAVRECAVIAREDIPGDKRLVAYFVPTAGANADPAGLRGYLQQHLPEYMMPAAFVVLQAMPLTPNGKIDKRGLPAPASSSAGETTAATDALQAQLVKIWEAVLGKKPIGIRDNFFELGGHSLLAARLMHRTGQALGKTLPLAMLFQAPTIERLTAVLRQDGWSHQWSSLVPIQPRGTKPPFFCVHGVGGNVLNFRELAQLMSPEHPFYGLQAQGLNGERPCFSLVEDMAGHYLKELKTIQPEGPYFIGGYSFGGLVAYEMAQQLRANGESVGLLALLDTYAGRLRSVSGSVLRMVMHPSRQSLFHDMPKAAGESLQRRVRSLLISRVLKNVLQSNQTAANRYILRPYAGKITLFRASELSLRSFEELYSAWTSLALGGLDLQEISGDHGGILVSPQVDVLAAKLKASIDKNPVSADDVSSLSFSGVSRA